MSFFLVVVTTFEDVFTTINEMRRQQCKKYSIPVLFVYNGKKPDSYTLQADEIVFPMENHAPAMFLKFKNVIQLIYNIPNFSPDFIVRVNARTFIDFPRFLNFLPSVPKQNLLAGYLVGKEPERYPMGICMILSKDVAQRFAKEDNVYGQVLWHSDDVTITNAVRPYSKLLDLKEYLTILTSYDGKQGLTESDIPKELPLIEDWKWLYRIKNGPEKITPVGQPMVLLEKIDVKYWKLLLKKSDNLDL